jgi:hypothetical protein
MGLKINQGATFRASIYCTSQRFVTATTSASAKIGALTVTIATGGQGEILAGDRVVFGTVTDGAELKAYLVDTGIEDLSLGGTLTLETALEAVVGSGVSVKVYKPSDLTGFDARAEIRPSATSPTVTAEIECSITEPMKGKIDLLITDEVTEVIPTTGTTWDKYETYQTDVEIYNATDVYRVYNGPILVSPEVTKNE